MPSDPDIEQQIEGLKIQLASDWAGAGRTTAAKRLLVRLQIESPSERILRLAALEVASLEE